MRFKTTGIAVVLIAAGLSVALANMLWAECHLTPGHLSNYPRTITLNVKSKADLRLFTISFTPADGTGQRQDPIRTFSHGYLTIDTRTAQPHSGGPVRNTPDPWKPFPMKAVRKGHSIVFTFHASTAQMNNLRFEFFDSSNSDAQTVGGGDIYWLLPREFAAAKGKHGGGASDTERPVPVPVTQRPAAARILDLGK